VTLLPGFYFSLFPFFYLIYLFDFHNRVQEHIKLRTGNEEGLVVNSLYWMECDGILICKRNPLIEEEDLDKNG